MASALYELSLYSNKKGESYKKIADAILEVLPIIIVHLLEKTKDSFLIHSTGSKPSNSEVDVPLSYADYYYMEALLRSKKLKEKKTCYFKHLNNNEKIFNELYYFLWRLDQ